MAEMKRKPAASAAPAAKRAKSTKPAKPLPSLKSIPLDSRTEPLLEYLKSLELKTIPKVFLQHSTGLRHLLVDTMEPLGIDIAAEVKSLVKGTHYVVAGGGKIFVNKYGVTKLLAAAPEAEVATMYTMLHLAVDDDANTEEIDRLVMEINERDIMLAERDHEFVMLQKEKDALDDEYDSITGDRDTLQNIANKLARYVRIRSRKPPAEVDNEHITVPYDDAPNKHVTADIVEDAAQARDTLRSMKQKGKSIGKPATKTLSILDDTTTDHVVEHKNTLRAGPDRYNRKIRSNIITNVSEYSIMMKDVPVVGIGNGITYRWRVDKSISLEYKEASEVYRDSDGDCVLPGEFVWYSDINATEQTAMVLSSMFEQYGHTVEFIDSLIRRCL